MIFVTIGTSEPFDRLLAAVDALDTDEEVVAQVGASTLHPAGAANDEFLSFDETLAYMREARVVVAHAGVGRSSRRSELDRLQSSPLDCGSSVRQWTTTISFSGGALQDSGSSGSWRIWRSSGTLYRRRLTA